MQLAFWGLFPSIYKTIKLGIPFSTTFTEFDIQDLNAAFTFAVIGLALNESAYMAEIVRAGILSVGEGQTEASKAPRVVSIALVDPLRVRATRRVVACAEQ